MDLKTVLIIGASSDIARQLGHVYGKNGYNLVLAGRNTSPLEDDVADLSIRYDVKASTLQLDVTDYDSHDETLAPLAKDLAGVICVAGYLGDHDLAKTDWNECSRILNTNYTGCVSVLNTIASVFQERKSGWIVGISSVAGDRGRQSNYFYGSAKAGFSAYLSGLRNAMFPHGVQVLTVKPGFVATKMTEGLDLPKPLTGSAKQVATSIFKAQRKKKSVLYTIWPWFWIMLIIRNIPEFMFKKMKL